jgi:hypothetical protein
MQEACKQQRHTNHARLHLAPVSWIPCHRPTRGSRAGLHGMTFGEGNGAHNQRSG